MIRGFYSARAGLIAHQEHMSVIANNLANINTHGFKPMRSAFTDLMYQNLNRVRNENAAQTGHGVKINKTDIMMQQGAHESTQRMLDFVIVDDLDSRGFFMLETEAGNIRYSRAGNFSLSLRDDIYYLVNGNGDYVLNSEGERIEIEFNEYTYETVYQTDENGDLILDDDGNPIVERVIEHKSNPDYEHMVFDPSVIGVFRFDNPWGLEAVNANSFIETEMSGEPVAVEIPRLMQGYLERSAVETANEMANVIVAQRAFSFSSRMVQVADEIEQTINQLR
ncbi:MAG: flagellar hook-basal body protein [Oscillospiraceae bacterium]|nr:flagellar hook-basal body protein [Oscillospiraceae bacterium]